MAGPSWAAELLRRLSVPRLPGSAAVRGVEDAIAARLRESGYRVERQSFTTSPRRLVAVAVAGAGCGWLAVVLVPLSFLDLPGWPLAIVGFAGVASVGLAALGIDRGHLSIGLPTVEAANIIGVRGRPRLWLVCHSDSKGQGVSLGGRVAALSLLAVGLIGVLGWLAAGSWGARELSLSAVLLALPALILTAGAGAALSRTPYRDDSPGAVDNATGIVAALVAAERLRHRADVAVLVTGAEEFGMEGASHWVREGAARGLFVNLDGLDTRGRFRVMTHRSVAGAEEARSLGAHVAAELEGAAPVVRRSLPPGVLVDGVVLARGGMAGVTVSRGDLGTLLVVHTSRDTVDRLDAAAVEDAGKAVARAVDRALG